MQYKFIPLTAKYYNLVYDLLKKKFCQSLYMTFLLILWPLNSSTVKKNLSYACFPLYQKERKETPNAHTHNNY